MTALPDIRQLRYFEAVARHRSFSRAAGELHISQQALSEQIRKLELQLGVTLFDRSTRMVEPTAAGKNLIREVPGVIRSLERAVQSTVDADGESPVTLAYTLTSANRIVPKLTALCRESSPAIAFRLREMFASDIPEALLKGQVDLAVIPGLESPAGLATGLLTREPLVAALPASHELAARDRIALPELETETFQLWPREMAPGYYDAVVAACRAAGFEPDLDASAGGNQVWVNIAEGESVGLIAAAQADALRQGIVAVPIEDEAVMSIGLMARDDESSPGIEAARDVLLKQAAQLNSSS